MATTQIELKWLSSGAQAVNNQINSVGQSFDAFAQKAQAAGNAAAQSLARGTAATQRGMQSLQAGATTLGMQAFPQLNTAVMAGTAGLDALRGASMATGASFGLVAGWAVIVAAAVATAVESFRMLAAAQNETRARANLMDQSADHAERLRDGIKQLVNFHKLAADEAERYLKILEKATPERVNLVRSKIRPLFGTVVDEAAAKKMFETLGELTLDLVKENLDGEELQREAATQTFRTRLTQIEDMRAKLATMRESLTPETYENLKGSLDTAFILAAKARDKAFADADEKERKRTLDRLATERTAEGQAIDEILRTKEAAAQKQTQADAEVLQLRRQMTLESLDGVERERAAIQISYQEQMELINRLREQKLLSDPEYSSLSGQAGRARDFQLGRVDDNSWAYESRQMMGETQSEWGSWAQQAAGGIKEVMGSAISSVSDGITGLIMHTKTWGQALLQIGTSIVTSVVGAIVQMGVRWVATQIMMAMFGKALAATQVAALAPIAAAEAAIWSAPATLAAIASYGGAAAAAPPAIGAAMAMTLGMAVIPRERGGPVDAGSPYIVGERGEELFIPSTSGQIVPHSALRAPGFDSAPVINTKIHFAGLFDSKAATLKALESAEGEAFLIDFNNRTIHRILG